MLHLIEIFESAYWRSEISRIVKRKLSHLEAGLGTHKALLQYIIVSTRSYWEPTERWMIVVVGGFEFVLCDIRHNE